MRTLLRRRCARVYSPLWIAVCSGTVPHWDDSAILDGMRIDFTKMHGAGNEFIVFDLPAGHALPPADRLEKRIDPHTRLRFHQPLLREKPRRSDTAVFYRIFNSDGNEVEQCGNGARCIAALLHHRGLTANSAVSLDSPAGLVRARIEPGQRVSVDMGVPNFD